MDATYQFGQLNKSVEPLVRSGSTGPAASKNPDSTVPGELSRQAKRIEEQLSALNIILDTVTDHLKEMQTMMKSYSPTLVKQFELLSNYLVDYKSRAGTIYGEVSDSLQTYAYNLLHNLDNLTNSVTQIGKSVENLK